MSIQDEAQNAAVAFIQSEQEFLSSAAAAKDIAVENRPKRRDKRAIKKAYRRMVNSVREFHDELNEAMLDACDDGLIQPLSGGGPKDDDED